jgi:hypothetical protein
MSMFEPCYYFRDHAVSGAWGVRDARTDETLAVGLDKNVAAAVACLLNGEIDIARSLLKGLPSTMETAQ